MEWECFWLNLREDNKMSESKMAVSESNMADFKMAAIIKLSQNEWVKFFLCKMAESMMAEFKMAAIIKYEVSLSQNESQKWEFFWLNLKMAESKMAVWIQHGRDGCHHQVEWEWMSEVYFCVAESKIAEFKMAAIIKLSENEWVWVRLN